MPLTPPPPVAVAPPAAGLREADEAEAVGAAGGEGLGSSTTGASDDFGVSSFTVSSGADVDGDGADVTDGEGSETSSSTGSSSGIVMAATAAAAVFGAITSAIG